MSCLFTALHDDHARSVAKLGDVQAQSNDHVKLHAYRHRLCHTCVLKWAPTQTYQKLLSVYFNLSRTNRDISLVQSAARRPTPCTCVIHSHCGLNLILCEHSLMNCTYVAGICPNAASLQSPGDFRKRTYNHSFIPSNSML